MPELPEVETMVRGLRPALEGRVLRELDVVDPFLLDRTTPDDMRRSVLQSRFSRVARRGKWVVLHLEPSPSLIVIQPRMTGGFFLNQPDDARHIRLIFHLEPPGQPAAVWFRDTRRLGKIACFPSLEVAEHAFDRSQGPDALLISEADLAARLRSTSRGIKTTLMDQKVLAGIGNIYADEILFRSGLHPEKTASSISRAQVRRVHQAIVSVLNEAIVAEGASFDAGYRTVLGLEGGFLAQNAVHRRRGQPCPRCGQPIVKERIAGLIGRPTYYCPKCQTSKPSRDRS